MGFFPAFFLFGCFFFQLVTISFSFDLSEKHEERQPGAICMVYRPLFCSQIQNTGTDPFIEKNVNDLISKKTSESCTICLKSNIQKKG